MAIHLERHLHHNHTDNSHVVNDKLVILPGDYGVSEPLLNRIEAMVQKITAQQPIRGDKKRVYLFSSLGTIEYALEMSGYSQQEIARLFADQRNRPQCLVAGNTIYVDCHDVGMDTLEAQLREVL